MFCKYCGNKIDEDAVFCPHCGKKQSSVSQSKPAKTLSETPKNVRSFFSNITSSSTSQTPTPNVIDLPQGHLYCPCCEKVKNKTEFKYSLDEEFNFCNSCKRKENKVWRISIGVPVFLFVCCAIFGIIYVLNNCQRDLVTSFGALAIGLFFSLVPLSFLFMLLNAILTYAFGVSIGNKKTKRLRSLVDQNGHKLFSPISHTSSEEYYKLKTGVYPSRDIPFNHFKCPCCDKIVPRKDAVALAGHDSEMRQIGRKIQTKTTTYNYNICSDCHKFKKYEGYIGVISLIIGIIMIPTIAFVYEGFSWGWLIGGLFLGMIAGTILTGICIFIFRIIIKISTGRNLFVSVTSAASNNALNPLR